jgi:hypothetical protein
MYKGNPDMESEKLISIHDRFLRVSATWLVDSLSAQRTSISSLVKQRLMTLSIPFLQVSPHQFQALKRFRLILLVT